MVAVTVLFKSFRLPKNTSKSKRIHLLYVEHVLLQFRSFQYLKFAHLDVHGKLAVVHGAHELDSGGDDEKDLVANAHPKALKIHT